MRPRAKELRVVRKRAEERHKEYAKANKAAAAAAATKPKAK